MNKFLFLLLLLLSSCSFFSKKNLNVTTLIANISTNIHSFKDVNLKLKTELHRDSAVIQIYPVVGLNLATILVKDENIYVNNKLTNADMVFSVLDFDPDINFKKLLKLAIQKKHFNDTVYYKNSTVHYIFSDYINVEITNSHNKSFFLPRHVSINRVNTPDTQKAFKIMIDYKLVKLNK